MSWQEGEAEIKKHPFVISFQNLANIGVGYPDMQLKKKANLQQCAMQQQPIAPVVVRCNMICAHADEDMQPGGWKWR